ncbi:MAG: NAAT family transporter [Bacteroidetes bacterium]|nr:NAAT family transporter [Bacteroidota bacterium]
MQNLSFQHYLLGLFAVANNIPAIPLYLLLIDGLTRKEQNKLCLIATIASFITMVVSMVTGMGILAFFDISVNAFRIAGGLLLLGTGFKMMDSVEKSIESAGERTLAKKISTAIVPIAIPLTTGAGTMSTIILFSQDIHSFPYLELKLFLAIVAMTMIIYFTFRYSPKIVQLLGPTGMDVLTKIFGLITLALGVQFILTGISGAFPGI